MVGSVAVIQDRLRHADIPELIKIVRPLHIGSGLDRLNEREGTECDEGKIKKETLSIFPCGLPKPNHV